MEDKNPDGSSFKVIDKRRFVDAGDSRDSSTTEPIKQCAPQEIPAQKVESPAAGKPKEARPSEQRPVSGAEQGDSAQGEVQFGPFCISLATQTLMMLGEVPHPETGQVQVNFDAARQTIDILAMLEDKTKGNLNSEEAKLLAEIISSLRIAFVERFRHSQGKKP